MSETTVNTPTPQPTAPMTYRGADGRVYKTEQMERNERQASQSNSDPRFWNILSPMLRAPD